MDKLKVAVVGCGIGRSHAQAYLNLPDDFEIIAICDVDSDKARDLAEACGAPRVTGDLAELCLMEDLDVIA
ncbi:MAG: Gfo/Idh/MocA family oxidoreductase, partial [Deinococcota bacterium]|nr:Gfo/Idh/MocA family oxidoreductase [Deinococcota bacterium]